MGFLGFCLGLATGALRVLYLPDFDLRFNAIPADHVINSILAVGREIAGSKTGLKQRIFNCVSDDSIILTYGR